MGALYGCSNKSKETGGEDEEYTPVSVMAVKTRNLSEQASFSGKIKPSQDIMITPKIPGKITNLNVEVGSVVKAGDVLFTVDKGDIQKQVDQAKKQVELAKSNYERSRDQIGQAGKQVELAESNYERTKEQIAQAKKSVDLVKSNYEKAKEQIDNAKINLERMKKLYELGAVSKNQYEQAELAASDKSLKALEIQIEQAELSASNSPLNTARIQIEQAKLGASDSVLDTARIQIEQAELSYSQALDALEDTNITSPISGVVSQLNVSKGEMASNAQPSVVIIDTSKIYVEIDVPENIVNNISVGQNVNVDIPSTNDTKKGIVEIVSPAPDDRTQLYSVKILMNEVLENIRSGMFAKANLNTNFKENVIAVNSESIMEDGTKSYVYVVNKDKAVRKEVEIGIDSGEYIEIISGLKDGEQVLVKGQDYVENGSRVKIIRGEK